MSKERREFFRVNFNYYVRGEIINTNMAIPIKIINMGAGWMCFISSTNLNTKKLIKCRFQILDKPFEISGIIKRKSSKGFYTEYGLQFETNPLTTSELFKQLNYYIIQRQKTS